MGVYETGSMTDRRAFISAGVSGAAALLSGCTSLSSDAKTGIDNSDGDGSNQSRSGDQLEPAQAPGPSVSIDSTEFIPALKHEAFFKIIRNPCNSSHHASPRRYSIENSMFP
jgi:hypothetical protein